MLTRIVGYATIALGIPMKIVGFPVAEEAERSLA